MFNGTNTILATKFGRQQSDYQRFFEQRSKSATGTVGFSTENLPTRHKQHVNYKTGHLAFVIRMEGLPFDGVDDKHLFTQFVSLRNLLAGMGKTLGNRLAAVGERCNAKDCLDREYKFQEAFCQQFADKYLNAS